MQNPSQSPNARLTCISYITGGLQGLAFSLLPALATLFTSTANHMSSGMYGTLFIPQTIFAIIGAFSAPTIGRRFSPIVTLRLGIFANFVALIALLLSTTHAGETYALLMIDAAALGLGFGLCNSSANAMVEVASKNPDRAITILNTITGLGTSLSPAIIAGLHATRLHALSLAYWQPWPMMLSLLFICVFMTTLGIPRNIRRNNKTKNLASPILLWLFVLGAVLYGTCEGSFSSWATAFAAEHGANPIAAEMSLTVFWLALTIFRIIATLFPKIVPLRRSIPPLAVLAGFVFAILPSLHGSIAMVSGYLIGGTACGIIYPYLIANALHALPEFDERVTGYLTGGLMIGEGTGSFSIGSVRSAIGLNNAYYLVGFAAFALAILATVAIRLSPNSTKISQTN